jgi:hypothetical protein
MPARAMCFPFFLSRIEWNDAGEKVGIERRRLAREGSVIARIVVANSETAHGTIVSADLLAVSWQNRLFDSAWFSKGEKAIRGRCSSWSRFRLLRRGGGLGCRRDCARFWFAIHSHAHLRVLLDVSPAEQNFLLAIHDDGRNFAFFVAEHAGSIGFDTLDREH